MTARKASNPFDSAAAERQRRMGLLDDSGHASIGTVAIVARVCAGMFYDDLNDACGENEAIPSIHARLGRLREIEDPRQAFLSICLAYDEMRRPLPELLWWISGSTEIVPLFVECFTDSLTTILSKMTNEGGSPT